MDVWGPSYDLFGVKQASKQVGKQTSRQANKQASGQADKRTSRQADKQTSRQAPKRTSGQADLKKWEIQFLYRGVGYLFLFKRWLM